MRYVDAGYIICMGALFLYAVGLVLRRRRLERAVAVAERDVGATPAGPAGARVVGAPPAPNAGPAPTVTDGGVDGDGGADEGQDTDGDGANEAGVAAGTVR